MSVISSVPSNYSNAQPNFEAEVDPDFCSSHPMPSSQFRPLQPFPEIYSYRAGMRFLTLDELAAVAGVSKRWKFESEIPAVWKRSCESNQFPLVVNPDGTERDYKKDVAILYGMTIGARQIKQVWGDVIGQCGNISKEVFDRVFKRDPSNRTQFMRDSYLFVCDFSFIKRDLTEEVEGPYCLPLRLNENGSLEDINKEEIHNSANNSNDGDSNMAASAVAEPTLIRTSTWNLEKLSGYPRAEVVENMPVFNIDYDLTPFDGSDTCVLKNSVYFMRREILKQTVGHPPSKQKKMIKALGSKMGAPELEITPFRIRVIANAVTILTQGNCPDDRDASDRYKLARFPDTFVDPDSGEINHVVMGGFEEGEGLRVGGNQTFIDKPGVVPGGPAFVSRPKESAKVEGKTHGKKRAKSPDLEEEGERKVEAKKE